MLKKYCSKFSKCLYNPSDSPVTGHISPDTTNTAIDNYIVPNNKDNHVNIEIMELGIKPKHKKKLSENYRDHDIFQKYYLTNGYYINDLGKKRIIFSNEGRGLKYPVEGWFQECARCYSPTGQHFMLEDIRPDKILVHICDNCYSKLKRYKTIGDPKYDDFIYEMNDALRYIDQGRDYISY